MRHPRAVSTPTFLNGVVIEDGANVPEPSGSGGASIHTICHLLLPTSSSGSSKMLGDYLSDESRQHCTHYGIRSAAGWIGPNARLFLKSPI